MIRSIQRLTSFILLTAIWIAGTAATAGEAVDKNVVPTFLGAVEGRIAVVRDAANQPEYVQVIPRVGMMVVVPAMNEPARLGPWIAREGQYAEVEGLFALYPPRPAAQPAKASPGKAPAKATDLALPPSKDTQLVLLQARKVELDREPPEADDDPVELVARYFTENDKAFVANQDARIELAMPPHIHPGIKFENGAILELEGRLDATPGGAVLIVTKWEPKTALPPSPPLVGWTTYWDDDDD